MGAYLLADDQTGQAIKSAVSMRPSHACTGLLECLLLGQLVRRGIIFLDEGWLSDAADQMLVALSYLITWESVTFHNQGWRMVGILTLELPDNIEAFPCMGV